VEGPAELFVEAVARVLAWVDEHKAHLFLAAAVAAGLIAASAAMNLWGLIELGRLAHAASLMPFIALGGVERSREEAFRLIKGAPDPYERFLEVAREANAGRIGLAEPWESLRKIIAPRPSEERRLVSGKAYGELDERGKKALFYAALALEEAFGVYRSALRKYAVGLKETMQRVEVGEGPFKRVVYVADVGQIKQLAGKEEEAFEDALKILRERLNEYAVKYRLGDLLDVKENTARELAEADYRELPEFSGVSFGEKAYAALMAYREHALGRRGAFGATARYWLEEGGSAWLLYYAPGSAYIKAGRAKAEGAVTVEGMIAEALRRLFLKPGAEYYHDFVRKLLERDRLELELEKRTEKSLVFKVVGLDGVKLKIGGVEEGEVAAGTYVLEFDARWREFFGHELGIVGEAAEKLRERWPIEDPLPYMLGWLASDVSIHRAGNTRMLYMSSSHFWQVAETKVLFSWSNAVGLRVGLTLEGPKLQFLVRAPLGKLDEAVRRSEWLKRLGVKAGSWDDLKQRVAERWQVVVDVAVRRLGEDVREELEALGDRLNDDKIAREAVAPALLLIQAEKLSVGGESLRYFAAVISGAIGGDGHASAAERKVGLASGKRPIALLWRAAFMAYGVKAKVMDVERGFNVVAYDDSAVRLARLYFLFGFPLLEGDDRLINHKLAEAVKLGAEAAVDIREEGLRRTEGGRTVTADLIVSEGGTDVKFNAYLLKDAILLRFQSTNRGRAELAARLLRLAGVSMEIEKTGKRGVWQVWATIDRLAAGRKELRDALAGIVRTAIARGWVNEETAKRWLEKLEGGRVLKEGWPKYHVGLNKGTLEVRYTSTNPDSIEQIAEKLRKMGLVEGVHFTVRMPEGGKAGRISILREGLERVAWLSIHGSGEQQELAAKFIGYILERAREEGGEVYEKAKEVVEEGRARGSLRLADVRKAEVYIKGRRHVVDVIGGGAQPERGRNGKTLLRIAITAEVDGVRGDYTMTYGRYGKNNAAKGYATAKADVPGDRRADAERFSALIKALTGEEPRVYEKEDGKIMIVCGREHLEGLMRYAELADAIERWLEETRR
jgi:Arc/MetJ family transcription regulator